MGRIFFKETLSLFEGVLAKDECPKCKGLGCRCGGRCRACRDHDAGLHDDGIKTKADIARAGGYQKPNNPKGGGNYWGYL